MKKKLKTHSGAKKRFKITGTGKIKIHHEGVSHIMTKKSSKRRRRLKKGSVISKEMTVKVKKLIPYEKGV